MNTYLLKYKAEDQQTCYYVVDADGPRHALEQLANEMPTAIVLSCGQVVETKGSPTPFAWAKDQTNLSTAIRERHNNLHDDVWEAFYQALRELDHVTSDPLTTCIHMGGYRLRSYPFSIWDQMPNSWQDKFLCLLTEHGLQHSHSEQGVTIKW